MLCCWFRWFVCGWIEFPTWKCIIKRKETNFSSLRSITLVWCNAMVITPWKNGIGAVNQRFSIRRLETDYCRCTSDGPELRFWCCSFLSGRNWTRIWMGPRWMVKVPSCLCLIRAMNKLNTRCTLTSSFQNWILSKGAEMQQKLKTKMRRIAGYVRLYNNNNTTMPTE